MKTFRQFFESLFGPRKSEPPNEYLIVEKVTPLEGSYNIPRIKMPQIKRKDIEKFLKFLKKMGVESIEQTIPVYQLHPTQNEINTEKVKEKVDYFQSDKAEVKPFIVSSDNHILDGHHQWAALKKINPNFKVPIYKLDIPMKKLLKVTHKYPKVGYKTIDDEAL